MLLYADLYLKIETKILFTREHINGMYRTDTFFLAKQLVETPLYVLEASIMFSIIYWIAGLNPEAERFFIALGIVILILQVSEKTWSA